MKTSLKSYKRSIIIKLDKSGNATINDKTTKNITTEDSTLEFEGRISISSINVHSPKIGEHNLDEFRLVGGPMVREGNTIINFFGKKTKDINSGNTEIFFTVIYCENHKSENFSNKSILSDSFILGNENVDFCGLFELTINLPDLCNSFWNKFLFENKHEMNKSDYIINDEGNTIKFQKSLIPNERFGPVFVFYWKEPTSIKKIINFVSPLIIGIVIGLVANYLFAIF